MFSVEHASSTGPAMEEWRACSVAKQAVDFPQVMASIYSQLYIAIDIQ